MDGNDQSFLEVIGTVNEDCSVTALTGTWLGSSFGEPGRPRVPRGALPSSAPFRGFCPVRCPDRSQAGRVCFPGHLPATLVNAWCDMPPDPLPPAPARMARVLSLPPSSADLASYNQAIGLMQKFPAPFPEMDAAPGNMEE